MLLGHAVHTLMRDSADGQARQLAAKVTCCLCAVLRLAVSGDSDLHRGSGGALLPQALRLATALDHVLHRCSEQDEGRRLALNSLALELEAAMAAMEAHDPVHAHDGGSTQVWCHRLAVERKKLLQAEGEREGAGRRGWFRAAAWLLLAPALPVLFSVIVGPWAQWAGRNS